MTKLSPTRKSRETGPQNQLTCFTCDRVSSRKQEDNTSLRAQKERGLKYAGEQGFHVVQNYSFVESASKRHRPNFHAMMNTALKTGVDIVVFKTVDRLARNLPDIQLVLDFIYEHDREIHLYDDGLRLSSEMDSNDALNFMLKGVLAKGETDRSSQRIRRALQYKVENGIRPGRPVVGYRYNKQMMKHEYDPEYKPVLEFLFNTYDTNDYSCQKMADIMNQQGFSTGCYGGKWTAQNIHKTLINPNYHGEFWYHDKLHQANPDHHEVYYSKSRFLRRMEKLAGNRQGLKTLKKQDPLSKFLRCSDCGATLTLDHKKKKSGREYFYFIHKCAALGGKQVSIPRDKVIDAVDQEIRRIRFSESFFTNLKAWFQKRMQEKDTAINAELAPIHDRITDLKRRIARLYDLWSDDELPLEELKEMRDCYGAEIIELREQQKVIEGTKEKAVCDAICGAVDRIKGLPLAYLEAQSIASKAQKLRAQLVEIKLSGEGPLFLMWKEPFSYIMRPAVLELALPEGKPSPRSSKKTGLALETKRKRFAAGRAGSREAAPSTAGARKFERPAFQSEMQSLAVGEFENITVSGAGGIRTSF